MAKLWPSAISPYAVSVYDDHIFLSATIQGIFDHYLGSQIFSRKDEESVLQSPIDIVYLFHQTQRSNKGHETAVVKTKNKIQENVVDKPITCDRIRKSATQHSFRKVSTMSDVTFTHVTGEAKVKRAPSVSDEKFKMTYASLAKQGKTNQEIAEVLGMNPSSLISRASALRAQLEKVGIQFPYAKTLRGQGAHKSSKMSDDKLKAFLESLDGTSTVG